MIMNKLKTTRRKFRKLGGQVIYSCLVLALLLTSANSVFAGEATGTIGNGGEGAVGSPETPANLTANAESTSQIEVSWDAVSGVDGYELYRNDALITTTSSTNYSDDGLTSGTTYSYKVRSYLASIKSNFSSVVSATTMTSGGGGGGTTGPSGGGGGGGVSTPPPTTPTPPTDETPPAEETPPADEGGAEGEVLGEKIDARQAQINQIVSEAGDIVGGDVNKILTAVNAVRDLILEANITSQYTAMLTGGISGLTAEQTNAITNFVAYGTDTTLILGAGERAGVVNSYKAAFGKLPTTADEWSDALKIANGRWPTERNEAAEASATAAFKKIYLREPDRTNPNDDAAVTIMSYGLRPNQRNLDSEKAGILSFKAIYGHNPSSATDWDAVRAIAYSGAIR